MLKLEYKILTEDWQKFNEQIAKLIARSWIDNDYRERFIADPRRALEAEGLSLPKDVEIRVDPFSYRWRIEPSADMHGVIYTIGLPRKPSDTTEEQIQGFMRSEGSDWSQLGLICCCC